MAADESREREALEWVEAVEVDMSGDDSRPR